MTGDTFVYPDNIDLVAWRSYRDEDGVKNLQLRGNRIETNGVTVKQAAQFVEITDCERGDES